MPFPSFGTDCKITMQCGRILMIILEAFFKPRGQFLINGVVSECGETDACGKSVT
jgi:hypothetical protein